MSSDAIALVLPGILPLPFRDRPDRALEGVVEPRILPDRPLPNIGEQRGPVELLALKADIGRHIRRRRLDDRPRLELAQRRSDRIERGRGRRCRGLLLSGFRSEEHTSEPQSLMRISYAAFCLKKTTHDYYTRTPNS